MSIRCGLAGDMTEKTSLDDLKIDRSGVDDSRSRPVPKLGSFEIGYKSAT